MSFCVEITEQSLGCRADAETLLKRLKTSLCYPCNFRCEAFYMVFLFIK